MRNKVIILSLVMMARLGFGQNFAPVGAKWTHKLQTGGLCGPMSYGFNEYFVIKDTLIDGFKSKKLKLISTPGSLSTPFLGNILMQNFTTLGVLIRTNGSKREFKFSNSETRWVTFYDTLWTKNTTCNINLSSVATENRNVKIIDTGSVSYNGKKTKWCKLEMLDDGYFFMTDSRTILYYYNLGSEHGFNAKFAYQAVVVDVCDTESFNCYSDAFTSIKVQNEDCDYFQLPTFTGLNTNIKADSEIIVTNPNLDNCIKISGITSNNLPIEIYNSIGNKVMFSIQNQSSNAFEVCLKDYSIGIYYLKIKNNSKTFKIILL
ncbi:MAG: T9SS C-terminal target domain-containing protein [Cytophagales bacterium]|nr:MAG: T9SS C-terminal target domain-containing protein [Cytophagales bacterium]